MIDLAELERLADAATPGPWWSDEFLTVMDGTDPGPGHPLSEEIALINPMRGAEAQQTADARYIAAADPSTVKALIARIRELEGAAREYLAHDGSGIARTDEWAGDYDASKANAARDRLRDALR